MRNATFEVPALVMAEFAQELTERELNNTITGVTDKDEIVIEVKYKRDESDAVDELEEELESLCDGMEEESEAEK